MRSVTSALLGSVRSCNKAECYVLSPTPASGARLTRQSYVSKKLPDAHGGTVHGALGCYIPEDDILHSHRRENLKSYIALTGWAL
jgi:hypothetical protein